MRYVVQSINGDCLLVPDSGTPVSCIRLGAGNYTPGTVITVTVEGEAVLQAPKAPKKSRRGMGR